MQAWSDDRVQWVIGTLLRWGVILAAAMVLAGGALYFGSCASAIPDYKVFHGVPPELRVVTGIVREAVSLNPLGLIQFGLLLLIATPVARVAFSVVAFALQRDRTYVVVTLFVLGVVLLGLTRESSKIVVPPERYAPMCVSAEASPRPFHP
jgi:uncharacterized membrane protein